MTEVVTPSPSDPKKTFDRQSVASKSYSSSAHLDEYENTIPPHPVGLKEPSQPVFKHKQHFNNEEHGLSRTTVTPDVGTFNEHQVFGPNPGNTNRNGSSANMSGSPLQSWKARVTNELDQIAEQSGEK